MSRTFAYARVSALGQTIDNQVQEIRTAGFAIEPSRVVAETVCICGSGLLPCWYAAVDFLDGRRHGFSEVLGGGSCIL